MSIAGGLINFKPQGNALSSNGSSTKTSSRWSLCTMAFTPLPRRPHRCNPLFEPVDHFLRGIAYLKTAYVSDKQRHLARLKVFAKVLNQDFNDFQF
jgi:hypothetical protein